MTLVAISAAYGAAGSRVGPGLARRLGVQFVDRAIALEVAERLDVSVEEAMAHEQPTEGPSLLQRLLSGFAGVDVSGAPAPVPADEITTEDFDRASREALRVQAEKGAGVILGRGAVAGLRNDPRVLRVRLSGPVSRRIEQAMAIGNLDRETAERALRRLDRAHSEYLRQYYDVDINDPGLYHLMIDSTAFSDEFCVELIARAAAALPALSPVRGVSQTEGSNGV
jgi:cytidylate kinase